jgi:hypothetical protein
MGIYYSDYLIFKILQLHLLEKTQFGISHLEIRVMTLSGLFEVTAIQWSKHN